MIKELRLINWNSFAGATLYIYPLTILIDSNASGKSNYLDAVLCFNRGRMPIIVCYRISRTEKCQN